MAVVGVLVETVVGHQHHAVADFVAQRAQRDLHHAVGGVGLRTARVLVLGDAEQHDGRHTEIGERPHLFAQALLRVLHDAGHRHDGLGRVDPLLHEERGDEVIHAHAVLGDQPPQRGRTAQPAHAMFGERHVAMVLRGTRPDRP